MQPRFTQRLKERIEQGLIEEVEALHAQGTSWETLDFYELEYRFVGQYLQGKIAKNDMFQKLNSAIRQFAKKQDTWLRRLERNGLIFIGLTESKIPLFKPWRKSPRLSFYESELPLRRLALEMNNA